MKNNYRTEEGIIYIEINCKGVKYETMVSESKLEKLMKFNYKWYGHRVNAKKPDIYVKATLNLGRENGKRKNKCIAMHRFLTDAPKEKVVDHKNGVTLDNTDENIGLASGSENQQNRHGLGSYNSSGVHGVSWHKLLNKWCVQIAVEGRPMYLGSFDNIDDAQKVRLMAEKRYHTYKDEIGNIPEHESLCKEEIDKLRLRATNTSGYEGVSWVRHSKKWQARIRKEGKRISLGFFENIEDAKEAYNKANIKN